MPKLDRFGGGASSDIETVVAEPVNLLHQIAAVLARAKSPEDPALARHLDAWDGLTAERRRQLQLHHLGNYLADCAAQCPHYAQSLTPVLERGALTWGRFRELPRIDRALLATEGAELRVRHPSAAWTPTSQSSTSGSTGTPIITEQTRARALLQGALAQRWHRWWGRDVDRDVGFVTEPLAGADPPHGRVGGRWAGLQGRGRRRVLTLRATPEEQLQWLIESGVGYLVTYPSNLRSLLACSRATGLRPGRLEQVLLSSEPIPPALVGDCRRDWDVAVAATYSSSELGALALQDPQGRYRTMDASVLVEILEDDGTPTPRGKVGRVVVTTLQERLRPLVRYEVGDYARVERAESDGLVLADVVGRERTMILTRGGRRVWPYFELGDLAARGVVRHWQLVQHRDTSLTLRVDAIRPLSEDDRALVRRTIDAISEGLPLSIEQVEAIARTPRGKYREVISELHETRAPAPERPSAEPA